MIEHIMYKQSLSFYRRIIINIGIVSKIVIKDTFNENELI